MHENISIYKVVIPVCLFVRPIMTQEPLERFASNFEWGTRETRRNVFCLVLRFEVEWVDFYSEKLVKIVLVRVNGARRSNHVHCATLGSQASMFIYTEKYLKSTLSDIEKKFNWFYFEQKSGFYLT